MDIRPMQQSDLEQVFSLVGSDPELAFLDWERDALRAALGTDRFIGLVLVDNEQRVKGVLAGGSSGVRAYIDHLIVDRSQRGKGYGKQLVQLAVATFAGWGVKRVKVTTTAKNSVRGCPTRCFYEEIDFLQQEGEVTLEHDICS